MNRFARFLGQRLHTCGYDLAHLAVYSGIPFQHLRKMADGSELPSRLALQSIAAVLEIDPARLAALAAADYADRKYGVISTTASEQLELDDVRLLWGRLSEAQKAILLATMRDFVDENKHVVGPVHSK